MAVIQSPSDATHLAEVTAGGDLQVRTPIDATLAGYVKLLDSEGAPILTTENGALDVSQDALIFWDQVDGSALNTNIWTTSASGMTVAQASGFITLNSGAALTASAYAILQSIRYLPMYGYLPLRVTINAQVPVNPQANAVMELGVGLAATNASPTDGCFFRWNASGQFACIISNGGSETSTVPLTPPTVAEAALFDIVIVEDAVQFFLDDVLIATVEVPFGLAFPTNAGRLPLFARVYNGGSSPAAAPKIQIGQVVVVQEAIAQNKPWGETLASLGRGAYQHPTTYGQAANHANSASPASATLSNTAAGYATLGGRYQFAAPAGAATDYALFAFQVPVGYQFYLTGVRITAMSLGAIGGLTGTALDWALGVNSSAVSLATADGAGTWARRPIPLGMQSFPITAPIGQAAPDIAASFSPPLIVDGGRYVHVIVQVPAGLATGSQIIRGDVLITGYYE